MIHRRWQTFVADRRRREYVIVIALFLLALLPRLYDLDAVPPGLNADEVYNIIDARSIDADNLPVFMPGNQGREALYFYLLAFSLRLFGTTIWALRLPSVLLGSGVVILSYIVGRDAFSRRVGFVASGLIAVSLWPIMLSRIGLRAISLAFMATLTVALFTYGLRDGRLRTWLLAGTALGLTLYTYIPARVFPLVIGGWLVWVWWRRRAQLLHNSRSLVLSLLLAALIFAPFGVYMVRYPDRVNQRIASMTNAVERTRAGEPQALLASVGGVLGMFSLEGDGEWRYHLAHRPIFDPLTSVFFYVGAGLCLVRAFGKREKASRQPEYALLLLWAGAMLAPNAVLNENPSFIRAAGAIVPVYTIAGVGFQAALNWVHRRSGAPRWVEPVLVGLGLAVTLAYTVYGYFGVWANHPEVRSVYHADQALIGRYLEAHPPPAGARVFVAYDYVYDNTTTLSLGLFTDQDVAWFAREDTFPWPAAHGDQAEEIWYFVTPQQHLPEDVLRYLGDRARQETVYFDGGEEAFTVYRLNESDDFVAPQIEVALSFGNGPQLIGYDLPETVFSGEAVTLRLHWRIPEEQAQRVNRLTYVQVHLADVTGVVRARSDTLLGYPQAGWESGDRFVQDVQIETPAGMLPGPATFSFGLRDDQGRALGGMQAAENGSSLLVRSRPQVDFTVKPEMTVYDDTLALVGANFRPLLTPGAALNIELNWVALQQPAQAYRVQLALADGEGGEPLLMETFELWPNVYPPPRWRPLEAVTTLHGLQIPVDFAADGPLALQALLLPATANGDLPVVVSGGETILGELDVDTRPRLFEEPSLAQESNARFGEAIRLLGYELDTTMAYPGGVLHLTLAWQAIVTPDDNYTVFNHLVGMDGQSKGQFDSPPVGDAWLTQTWLPGEVVVEKREIPIAADAAPGGAKLVVGLYAADDLQRLSVTVDGEVQAGEQLYLEQVEIVPQPESDGQ